MSRRDETTVRIVPLGPVDAETVAECAFRAKRLSRGTVEVAFPRRLGGSEPRAFLSQPVGDRQRGEMLTLGIGLSERGAHVEADPERRVGVLEVPRRRPSGGLGPLVAAALQALLAVA